MCHASLTLQVCGSLVIGDLSGVLQSSVAWSRINCLPGKIRQDYELVFLTCFKGCICWTFCAVFTGYCNI